MNKLLEVKGITKSFDGVVRLNSISFSLYNGDFLIIAGANGSGKTLLMKHLNGLYSIKKSTLFFNGEDCYKKENLMKKRIGLIFQNPDNQIVGLTVKSDIAFGPKNLGWSKSKIEDSVNNSLEHMDIIHLEDRNPHTLSGGEKKKVTIAGVLAMKPDIIVFDEPFIGLDYPGVVSVTKSLIKLKEAGFTVIIISHDLEKITAYGNRMIIMSDGEIKLDGKPEDIIDQVGKYGIRRPIQKSVDEMTWLI